MTVKKLDTLGNTGQSLKTLFGILSYSTRILVIINFYQHTPGAGNQSPIPLAERCEIRALLMAKTI